MKFVQFIAIVFLLLHQCLIYGQDVDDLVNQLSIAKSDTTKLRLLVELSDACEINEIDKYTSLAILLADKLLLEKKYNKKTILIQKATAINNLAFLNHTLSKSDRAVVEYQKSLEIFEEVDDTNGIIMACNNIAMLEKDLGHIDITIKLLDRALDLSLKSNNVEMLQMTHTNYSSIYVRMGLINKALEHAYSGLKIQEKIGNDYGKGYALNNIASLFFMQKDLKKAEDFFLKSLEVRTKIKDEVGISTIYNNLAKVYEEQNLNDKALDYYLKCLEKRNLIKNKDGVAQSYSNLGSFYLKLGNPQKTNEYYQKAIEIREQIYDKEGLANSYQKMAEFLLLQNKIKDAEKFGVKALRLSEELGFNGNIESSAKVLSNIYEKLGNYKSAFEMHKLYVQMRDSLFNAETQKSILTQQINYEYDKKKLTDSLQFAKEQEVKDLAIAKQDAQLKQEKTQRFALYGGLVLIIIFAGVVYNRFRIIRKQNHIIEAQKQEVEKQKELVEEKHKEILDSIRYAKRIQDALLTSQNYIERNLKRLTKS
ncbi:MAG: tetratricopeptide repeat protein [Bacteroidetes bacterium]|nr:tetratricopeptide repeat protein [Bacteroidota bacterium]